MADDKGPKNCLPCKITSVCCLLGIGGYLIYQGQAQAPKAKYTLFLLGASSIALGIGEIFDKSPFRNYKKETE